MKPKKRRENGGVPFILKTSQNLFTKVNVYYFKHISKMTNGRERLGNLELEIIQTRMDVAKLKKRMSYTRQLYIDLKILRQQLRKSSARHLHTKKHL